MTQDMLQKAKSLIVKHESYRQFPYLDTTGHTTIGFGHNLDANGMSMPIALKQLDEDIDYWCMQLSHKLPFFDDLCEARQVVLIDMAHNLGLRGLFEFHEMLAALERKDYVSAAQAMLDSRWSFQVGHRAIEDISIMKTGEINV